MAIDFEKVETDLRRCADGANDALTKLTLFLQGKTAGLTLTSGQKNTLKAGFAAEVATARDAAQAVIDELAS